MGIHHLRLLFVILDVMDHPPIKYQWTSHHIGLFLLHKGVLGLWKHHAHCSSRPLHQKSILGRPSGELAWLDPFISMSINYVCPVYTEGKTIIFYICCFICIFFVPEKWIVWITRHTIWLCNIAVTLSGKCHKTSVNKRSRNLYDIFCQKSHHRKLNDDFQNKLANCELDTIF